MPLVFQGTPVVSLQNEKPELDTQKMVVFVFFFNCINIGKVFMETRRGQLFL